jgi:hypothetical protein
MFAVGVAFHWLIPVLAPSIARLYGEPPFRPWPSWTMYYMMVHPFWFGFAFACLFAFFEPRPRTPAIGARFGALLFLVGALPVYFLIYASIAISGRVILCWLLQGFSQYVLAGAALGLRRVSTSPSTPGRRSGWGLTAIPRKSPDVGDDLRQLGDGSCFVDTTSRT